MVKMLKLKFYLFLLMVWLCLLNSVLNEDVLCLKMLSLVL